MLVDAMTVRMTLKPQSLDTLRPIFTRISCRTLRQHSRAPSALRRRRILIPSGNFHRCSSRSMARPSITPVRAHRQSGQEFLVGNDDARSPRRDGSRGAANAGDRTGHRRQGAAHARPRRAGDDAASDPTRSAMRCAGITIRQRIGSSAAAGLDFRAAWFLRIPCGTVRAAATRERPCRQSH